MRLVNKQYSDCFHIRVGPSLQAIPPAPPTPTNPVDKTLQPLPAHFGGSLVGLLHTLRVASVIRTTSILPACFYRATAYLLQQVQPIAFARTEQAQVNKYRVPLSPLPRNTIPSAEW